jgi:predicted nucleotide-binding protein
MIDKPLSKNVFIVHGTDHASLKELKTLLEGVGLNPIILHDQPSKGKTLIEKLEEYSKNVGFAFIILTPDDVGIGSPEAEQMFFEITGKKNMTQEEIMKFFTTNRQGVVTLITKTFGLFKQRARQNVVLEFGYFIGKLGRVRVCCLHKGTIELPSDMGGICFVRFENSVSEAKELILNELRAVGYELKPEELDSNSILKFFTN